MRAASDDGEYVWPPSGRFDIVSRSLLMPRMTCASLAAVLERLGGVWVVMCTLLCWGCGCGRKPSQEEGELALDQRLLSLAPRLPRQSGRPALLRGSGLLLRGHHRQTRRREPEVGELGARRSES